MKKLLLFALCLSLSNLLFADPPKPPLGKRWVMNPDFSDEFNTNKLDDAKWFDHHPKWKGREPGIFLPSQVSVADGFMQIKGEKLAQDTIVKAYGREFTFNIAGGAVVSKKAVFLGYYECRVKAAATTMSTTFWFSSGKSYDAPNGCDKYGLEWDIQECIGRTGDFKGKFFAKGMHSNSHYWYTDCDKEKHDHRAPDVRFEDKALASDDFHTYGGWWHDETMASYYYDNGQPKFQKFYNKVSDKPFDQPMHMRLVSETYPFPWIELPTDQELADPTKNTVYYDWVRGYELVDADDAEGNGANTEAEINLYYEDLFFEGATIDLSETKALNIPISYKANSNREIHFLLKDSEGKKVASGKYTAYAGYANTNYKLLAKDKLKTGESYTLLADMRPIGGEKKEALNKSTLIINLKK